MQLQKHNITFEFVSVNHYFSSMTFVSNKLLFYSHKHYGKQHQCPIYLQPFLFFIANLAAYRWSDDNEAEHDDEGELCLQNENKSIIEVWRKCKFLQKSFFIIWVTLIDPSYYAKINCSLYGQESFPVISFQRQLDFE